MVPNSAAVKLFFSKDRGTMSARHEVSRGPVGSSMKCIIVMVPQLRLAVVGVEPSVVWVASGK